MKDQVIPGSTSQVRSTVLVDGADSLYSLARGARGVQKFSFTAYNSAGTWKEGARVRLQSEFAVRERRAPLATTAATSSTSARKSRMLPRW